MMNTNRKVEEVMQSLHGIARAEAPPFIPGRVLDSLRDGRKYPGLWEKIAEMVARPSMAFALFILLLAVNVYFVSFSDGAKSESSFSAPGYDYTVTDFSVEEIENILP